MQQLGLDLPDLQSVHRWERLMDNPEEMVEAYMGTVDAPSICKVPRHYVSLIAEAFQRLPAAIEAAMAISFSFEEFKVQVNGGGNQLGVRQATPTDSCKWRRRKFRRRSSTYC
jgi:hypothetical protein